MKKVIIFVYFLQGLLLGENCFHAILVGDTLDMCIGQTCIPDVYRMEKSLQSIARHLGMPLKLTVLGENDCCSLKVVTWFKNLNTESNDIIFFTYAGHGQSDLKGNPWPHLRFREGGIAGIEILRLIRNKKYRLAVVLLDCCNSYGETDRSVGNVTHYIPIISASEHPKGISSLFAKTKGFIVGAAASPGEVAGGKNWGKKWGGYFTTGVLVAMKKLCVDAKISWKRVFKYAAAYTCRKSNGYQHPIYKIDVEQQ